MSLKISLGNQPSGLVQPLRYDPAVYLHDPRVRRAIEPLAPLERAALAEEVSGVVKTHTFYAVPAARAVRKSASMRRPRRACSSRRASSAWRPLGYRVM